MNAGSPRSRRFLQEFGLIPSDFDIVVAVLAHERAHGVGVGPTRMEVARLMKLTTINARSLIKNRWLKVDDRVGVAKQKLIASPRAWANLWPWREAWPEPQKKTG